jgi:tight adherence protein C
MRELILSLSGLVAIIALYVWFHKRSQRIVAQNRLATANLSGFASARTTMMYGVPEKTVARWLFLAGRRGSDATSRFWLATFGFIVLGISIGAALWLSGVLDGVVQDLETIPGGVGHLFMPIVMMAPFALPLILGSIPTARVRRARRARVKLLLRDLYPALELFASLAQAGLAFDAALARVLTTIGSYRPLGRELTVFQAEVMGGAQRTRCFRRLARRVEVSQVSSFTAALIRAHEVGIGLAATLRRQADDLRNELRERALSRAQSLPAQLVFPLVICFLPGIFVMSLGPAFYGFLVDTSGFGSTR